MESSVHYDLDSLALDEFKQILHLESADWLNQSLQPLYRSYLRHTSSLLALEDEIQQLCQGAVLKNIPSHQYVIEDWIDDTLKIYDIAQFRNIRNLLGLVFIQFQQSKLIDQISVRLNMPLEDLINYAPSKTLLGWFLIWCFGQYPQLGQFIFGRALKHQFSRLLAIPVTGLAHYLPEFLLWQLIDSSQSKEHRNLLIQLAAGQSARSLTICPIPFSKRMAHLFINTPKGLNLKQAIWRALILGIGGDQRLLQLIQYNYFFQFGDIHLLKRFLSFYQKHLTEMGNRELVHHLLYLKQIHRNEPAFSMKGWTLQSLRRKSHWNYPRDPQTPLYTARLPIQSNWPGASYADFHFIAADGTIYTIVQLKSFDELAQEGKDLKHCVRSYAWKCINHGTSIWSLRRERNGMLKKLVTIEVNKQGRIIQARKKVNALPRAEEWEIINQWAKIEHLDCLNHKFVDR